MHVQDLMTQPIATCHVNDPLNLAAQLMWNHDCGFLPVVNDEGVLTGVLTDRDICMAAYTQGRRLDDIPVSTAMATEVFTCAPDARLEGAEHVMRNKRVRRLVVVDTHNRPIGVLSVDDIVRSEARARPGDDVIGTLATIARS